MPDCKERHVYLCPAVLFSKIYENPLQHDGLVQNSHNRHLVEEQVVLDLYDIANIVHIASNNSLTNKDPLHSELLVMLCGLMLLGK